MSRAVNGGGGKHVVRSLRELAAVTGSANFLRDVELRGLSFESISKTLHPRQFKGVRFVDVSFVNADLANTRFEDCLFVRCSLAGANLTGADLIDVTLDDAINDASVVDVNAASSCWSRVTFNTAVRSTSFEQAQMTDCTWPRGAVVACSFELAELTNVDVSGVYMVRVSFEDACLNNVRFTQANLKNVDFGNAALTEVNFVDASMVDVNLRGAELVGTLFDGAELDDQQVYTFSFPVGRKALMYTVTYIAASNQLTMRRGASTMLSGDLAYFKAWVDRTSGQLPPADTMMFESIHRVLAMRTAVTVTSALTAARG